MATVVAASRKWSRDTAYRLPAGTSELTATTPVYTPMNVPAAMSTAQRTPHPTEDGEPSGFWWRKICSGRNVPRDVILHAARASHSTAARHGAARAGSARPRPPFSTATTRTPGHHNTSQHMETMQTHPDTYTGHRCGGTSDVA